MQAALSLVCPSCGRRLPNRNILDRYMSCLVSLGGRASAAQVSSMLGVRRNIAGKRLTQLAEQGRVRINPGSNLWSNNRSCWIPKTYELVTQN